MTGNGSVGSVVSVVRPWPASLAAPAFHGPAGEAVALMAPSTESDPAGLLVQLLCGFGNVVGRRAYYQVEADRHYTNTNVVLVGASGKGRKGLSWGRAKAFLAPIDPEWAHEREVSGMSSGEGLIQAVRDPADDEESDVASFDKRLLVFEPEFGRALRSAGREGNILSAIIRQAWDTGTIRTLTRTAPLKASGAHISIIAHITAEELARDLTRTDAANGFGNRFLWVAVRRSNVLPFGGRFEDENIAPLAMRFVKAAGTARIAGRVEMGYEARQLWVSVYEALSDGRPGLHGSVTGRAEAQVVRLALIYALLDEQTVIGAEHLRAALAVWEYCDQSAAYIFGGSTGDRVADEIIHRATNSTKPFSRTQIRDWFNRNKTEAEIEFVLAGLESVGVLERTTSAPTGGRPKELWQATELLRPKRQNRQNGGGS